MCNLDLYFRYQWGKTFQEFFTPKEVTLDKELVALARPNGQTISTGSKICKNVQMRPTVGQDTQS